MTRAHDPQLEEIARHFTADDPRLASRMCRVRPWTRWRWWPLRDRVATAVAGCGIAAAAALLAAGWASAGIVTCLVALPGAMLVTRPWTRPG